MFCRSSQWVYITCGHEGGRLPTAFGWLGLRFRQSYDKVKEVGRSGLGSGSGLEVGVGWEVGQGQWGKSTPQPNAVLQYHTIDGIWLPRKNGIWRAPGRGVPRRCPWSSRRR